MSLVHRVIRANPNPELMTLGPMTPDHQLPFKVSSRRRHTTRDVKVSRPAWSRDQFFGLGLSLGLTLIGLGLGLGLMKYWPRVSYALVSWSQRGHLLSSLINNLQHLCSLSVMTFEFWLWILRNLCSLTVMTFDYEYFTSQLFCIYYCMCNKKN